MNMDICINKEQLIKNPRNKSVLFEKSVPVTMSCTVELMKA